MQEELFTAKAAQSFAYEIKKDSAVIRRCFSHDTTAEIPDEVDGYPVTEIGPYAFSRHLDEQELEKEIDSRQVKLYIPEAFAGSVQLSSPLCGDDLEEIRLPKGIRRVGRYCFYNCNRLHRIQFYGQLSDWGSGVFTGCHHMENMCVYTDPNGKSYLKDVLDELPESLRVQYFQQKDPEGGKEQFEEAHLVFPEFYEEGVENTPARILETHVHGSGISYRNSFQSRKFDFYQYDLLFPYAEALESPKLVADLVLGRLRWPLGLTQKAKEQYETYMEKHTEEIAGLLIDGRDMDGIRWLVEFLKGSSQFEKSMAMMADHASRASYPEAVSLIMSSGPREKKGKKKRLEL